MKNTTEDYMASEHLALPESSNVVALSYSERDDDVRRARLVREKQSRETEDRMERTGRGRLRMS